MHTLNGASARHKFSHPLDQVAGNIYIIYIFLYKKEKKKKEVRQYFSLENHMSWLIGLLHHTKQCAVFTYSLSLSLSHSTQSDYTIRNQEKGKKKHILINNIFIIIIIIFFYI